MMGNFELTKRRIDNTLKNSLENATDIITKNYLDKLENYEIITPSLEDIDINVSECGKFYKISKLVFNKEESFLDKLTTIVNVVSSINSTLATVIRSDGNNTDYYIGIISKSYRADNKMNQRRRRASAEAFKGAMIGNLTGSVLTTLEGEEISNLQDEIFNNKISNISSISGVVALRNESEKSIKNYVQGIENLTDSLRGQKYTIMLIADPISNSELSVIKEGYEMIYSQLATFAGSSVTLNESDTLSLSSTQTEGITQGISTGISMTQSKTSSVGRFRSNNIGYGASLGLFGTGVSINSGSARGDNVSVSNTDGHTTNQNESRQHNQSTSKSVSSGKQQGTSIQLSHENRSVKALLNKIDKHLERLEICESFGAFNCAAYVIAESKEEALAIASNYNALMRGEESCIQASHINSWNKEEEASVLTKYLKSFVHPRFSPKGINGNKEIIVTPASIISGKEIAIQIGLPKKSINGISVVSMSPFGRNILTDKEKKTIELGVLHHMGQDEATRVNLDLNSLASHTFITGSTGAGKSNTIYHILDSLVKENIKFMVVEPAKGEYKHVFGNRKDVSVYGTNSEVTPLLRINPFMFPKGIHVLEHIDRLIEIFNVCWPMYAAMPAVLKEAVEDAYSTCGWDLDTSKNKHGKEFYPSFYDVMESLNNVINNSAYSDELKSNYKGSLLTRVRSLTNGLNRKILCNGEVDTKTLFDENVIIDLSRVGSVETKALIMGILVMCLQEYRMTGGGINSKLKHITVLEEAHNLLKRTSSEQLTEGSNILGKSVEMLANSIAEMRTYGEGFIIADQAPGLLDISVIRNTNTKIILRIPDHTDRELVGGSIGLNEDQIIEVSKLPVGVAVVYQNNWLEAALCRIKEFNYNKEGYIYSHTQEGTSVALFKKELMNLLMKGRINEHIEVDIDYLVSTVDEISLSTKVKIMLNNIFHEYKDKGSSEIWNDKNFGDLSELVAGILNAKEFTKNITKEADSYNALTIQIAKFLDNIIPDLSVQVKLSIEHCLMKSFSRENTKSFSIYSAWVTEARKGGIL